MIISCTCTTPVVVVSCVSGIISRRGGDFCSSNRAVNFGCTVITVNIVAYVSGTAVNVTTFVIISISVLIGVSGSGGSG